MSGWRPRLREAIDLRELPLGAEEGFVLSRLDGATTVSELRALTGMSEDRVASILERLLLLGVVQPPPDARPATPPPPATSPTSPPAPASSAEPAEEGTEDEDGAREPAVPTTARALFGQHLRLLDEAERVSRAAEAKEPELSAFCFDPLPNVARALLTNPNFNLNHARMLARFHTAPPGLEALAARGGVARDPVVERCLLRNPRLPVGATRRLLAGQRLLKLWLLHQDREVPELARKTGKEVLRSRFGSAPAEERVDLIMRTDGRVLLSLGGIPVDGRTASLLCQRSYRSPLLILNLARWGACPPQVLVHLWKQPAVRHQLQLRQALLRHPNLPSEFKREAS